MKSTRRRMPLAAPVLAVALVALAAPTAFADGGDSGRMTTRDSGLTSTSAAALRGPATGAPRYAAKAAVAKKLLKPKKAWKAVGGTSSGYDKKTSSSKVSRSTLQKEPWNEVAVTRGLQIGVKVANSVRPWLVGTMDEGTAYSAIQKFPRNNVYYAQTAGGSVRSCKMRDATFSYKGNTGRVLTCTVTVKGAKKAKYKTAYGVMRANSAMVFGECVRLTKSASASSAASCARKLTVAQWKKARKLFAAAPGRASMPPAESWNLDVLKICDSMPCTGTATVPGWYPYNHIASSDSRITPSVDDKTLSVKVTGLPAATTTFTLTVSAPYEWAPPVSWKVTVVPPLIAVGGSDSYSSLVYSKDDPSDSCYTKLPSKFSNPVWCGGIIPVTNKGAGDFDKIEVRVASNPSNKTGVGKGYAQARTKDIVYWPRTNGPFTDTVQYRLVDTATGFTSTWVNYTVSFANNPNYN